MSVQPQLQILNIPSVTNLAEFSIKQKEQSQTKNIGTFEAAYQAAIDIFDETNLYQKQADQIQIDFAAGKTDNILSVMLAQDKAYNSLNLTVQVTNKLIESYREIMRMQL